MKKIDYSIIKREYKLNRNKEKLKNLGLYPQTTLK